MHLHRKTATEVQGKFLLKLPSIDQEDFMRGVLAKFGPRCFFCNLEIRFKSACPQFWIAVADNRHSRQEEASSGVRVSVKANQALRLCQALTAANGFNIDFKAAARDALNRVQQELAKR